MSSETALPTWVRIRGWLLLCVTNHALVADGEFVAALGATAGEHGTTVLGFHALAEPVGFRPLAVIRLKCTFWHLTVIPARYGRAGTRL